MSTVPSTNGNRYLTGLFPLLWISILGFILYGQTITFDYTYLDDHELILGRLEQLGHPDQIAKAFTEDAFHTPGSKAYYYRPILTVSFVADRIIGGGSFAMFHVTNIILHILASGLLFLLLAEMGYDRLKSFLFTLIFVVHPVLVHAVAWVPGRNDTLLAVFVFASILFFLRYIKTRLSSLFILHSSFFLLALFTKETAIVLPVICFIYALLTNGRNMNRIMVPSLAWVIITPAWIVLRYHVLGGSHGYPVSESLASIIHNLPALLPFIGKSLVPAGLSVFPIMKDMMLSMFMGIAGILAISTLIILTKQKDWRRILFAVAWFLLFLIPAFIKSKSQEPDFTEHRVYVSLAGLIMLLLEIAPFKSMQISPLSPRSMNPGSFLIFLIFFIFLIFSVSHSRHYRNRIAFWTNAVERSPSHAFNYNNLGAMYYLDNNLSEAEKYFRKAVAINPSEPLANGNIGLVCMNTGRDAEAEKYYLNEIQVNPTYDNVYFNLGLLYYRNNLIEPAVENWEKTIRVNPHFSEAYGNLLQVYSMTGRGSDEQRIRVAAAANGITVK